MNQTAPFCECESSLCECKAHCKRTGNLLKYIVASFGQRLCPRCAAHARAFCAANGYEIEIVRKAALR